MPSDKRRRPLAPPNYTQLPNAILDRMTDFGDADLRVMLAVCRQTFGYHRRYAPLSLRDIARITGLGLRHARESAQRLTEIGWLDRKQKGQSFVYKIIIAPPV